MTSPRCRQRNFGHGALLYELRRAPGATPSFPRAQPPEALFTIATATAMYRKTDMGCWLELAKVELGGLA